MSVDEKKSEKKPIRKKAGTSRGMLCEELNFASKEAFKRLRTNVMMALSDGTEECRIIGVTSAQPSEGKSTISVNLAYSIAELGKRVLLVDADLRRPSIHQKLGIEHAPGLSNLLHTTKVISTTIQRYKSQKDETGFDVIPVGDEIDNPSELLESNRMGTLLKLLANAYEYIIIDLPPVGAVIDAVPVSKLTNGMLVAIRENNCPRGVFSDCIEQLKLAKVNILGFVVNGALEGAGKRYQYGYYN